MTQRASTLGPIAPQGTGWRAVSARGTLRRVWPLRQRIGISRVGDLTELDRIGIPVVAATRPMVDSSRITASQGKGFTITDACVSALMEAFERHAASAVTRTEAASIVELERQQADFLSPADVGGSIGPLDRLEWTEALSVMAGKPALVPASEVFFPYFPPDGVKRATRPCTTGLASGNSLVEAILHGIFEVVERSFTSRCWVEVIPELLPRTAFPPVADKLCRLIESAGAACFAVSIPGAVLPTFSVFTFDPFWLGPKLIIGGHGTHLDPSIALCRALCEAAQSRVVALQGSREDLHRHQVEWEQDAAVASMQFNQLERLAANESRNVTSSGFAAIEPPASLEAALEDTCRVLAAKGFPNAYYRDLTDPSVAVPVARVIVPGLIDRFAKGHNSSYETHKPKANSLRGFESLPRL